jgi:hypothetical protein
MVEYTPDRQASRNRFSVFAYFSWDALLDNGELITRIARIRIPDFGDEREAAKLRSAGGGGAQRPFLCVSEPKKMGARNVRAHIWDKIH